MNSNVLFTFFSLNVFRGLQFVNKTNIHIAITPILNIFFVILYNLVLSVSFIQYNLRQSTMNSKTILFPDINYSKNQILKYNYIYMLKIIHIGTFLLLIDKLTNVNESKYNVYIMPDDVLCLCYFNKLSGSVFWFLTRIQKLRGFDTDIFSYQSFVHQSDGPNNAIRHLKTDLNLLL